MWCYSCDSKTIHEVRFISELNFAGNLMVCTLCWEDCEGVSDRNCGSCESLPKPRSSNQGHPIKVIQSRSSNHVSPTSDWWLMNDFTLKSPEGVVDSTTTSPHFSLHREEVPHNNLDSSYT